MSKFFGIAVALVTVLASANAFAAATAVYDYSTGNIKFNDVSGAPVGFVILSTDDAFLNRDAATNLGGLAQSVDKSLPGSVTWANFGGFPAGTGYDGGNIIKPGTSPAALSFKIQADFVNLVDGTMEVINIPEPATLAMAGLGLVGIVAAARRKA